MLADQPFWGLDCDGAPRFWYLRVSRIFDQPKYFIGQTVFHVMKVERGEILHPVTIIGIGWSRTKWEYEVELPSDHPGLGVDNLESTWLFEDEIEQMY